MGVRVRVRVLTHGREALWSQGHRRGRRQRAALWLPRDSPSPLSQGDRGALATESPSLPAAATGQTCSCSTGLWEGLALGEKSLTPGSRWGGGNQQGVDVGRPWGVGPAASEGQGGMRGPGELRGPPSPFSCSLKCLCSCLGCPDGVEPSLTVTSPSFRSGPLHTPNQHPEAERPAQASERKQSHPPHPTPPHPPRSRGVGAESTAGGSCLLGLAGRGRRAVGPPRPAPPLPSLPAGQ